MMADYLQAKRVPPEWVLYQNQQNTEFITKILSHLVIVS